MLISLTVNYLLDVDSREDFFDAETGKLRDDISEKLNSLYPEKISLSENVEGRKNNITHVPLIENKNCYRCEGCGKLLSNSGAVWLGIDRYIQKDGKFYCTGCEWEMRATSSK